MNSAPLPRLRRFSIFSVRPFKDTHKESASSKETQALTKSMDMSIWVVGTLNHVFMNGSYTENKLKLVPIVFALTLAFDRTVLYGKISFSVLVLSHEKVLQFFKEGFSF